LSTRSSSPAPSPSEIYLLSLHDALPICERCIEDALFTKFLLQTIRCTEYTTILADVFPKNEHIFISFQLTVHRISDGLYHRFLCHNLLRLLCFIFFHLLFKIRWKFIMCNGNKIRYFLFLIIVLFFDRFFYLFFSLFNVFVFFLFCPLFFLFFFFVLSINTC